MHLMSIPRHRLETTFADYARIAGSLIASPDRADITTRFEEALAAYVGSKHAIVVSSGRLGMHLIIEQLGLEAGCEAIVPAFNLFAIVERFRALGIIPRFCDIEAHTLNVDPVCVEALIGPKSRVLLVTHMFGHAADMDALLSLARKHNLILLEDCAHALGTHIDRRHLGTFGRAAIFSFSVLKLVTTFGGGMIATNDDELAAGIRAALTQRTALSSLRGGWKKAATGMIMDLGTRALPFSFGAWPTLRLMRMVRPDVQQRMMTESPQAERSFDVSRAGTLHAFQSRLGLSQLARCEEFIAKRRAVGAWLDAELPNIPQVRLLDHDRFGTHNGLYYGVLAERSEALCEYLFRRGIDCETSEYRNCAELSIYQEFASACPVAHDVQRKILRLPNHPGLSARAVRRIAATIRRFYS